ncbi:LPS export ABC transporter ATP-binding protein [Arenicella xantha]|uniref:Lipopolysaccharide export system ATP-binding protein LptB n=1 Tax=Arenicella xantha TaxID=644221 RepID=A0A395JIF6_9GAMM|nr:LPS export ABC transporter ATP-binding protein [Arenicella xantha]RBP49653.1 lipopolysaccharide export system ATP-binding protein [Arenicella xantha]
MSILETKDLCKSYKGLEVVKKINISVESGQVVGLLGPNGAGKTTSFYMVVGLVRSDSGKILLNGQDISHLPMHSRARLGIGYLPQEASIFRKLTVQENLMAVLETDKSLSSQERSRRVEQLLEEFNIGHKRDTLGISLSGGERRRAEIARAIALRPYFILLDEPFAGIDPISVGDIQQIIDYLRNTGIGIIITDHNVRETLDICDHSYILTEGRVLTQGTAKQILSHQGVRDVYLGSKFKI